MYIIYTQCGNTMICTGLCGNTDEPCEELVLSLAAMFSLTAIYALATRMRTTACEQTSLSRYSLQPSSQFYFHRFFFYNSTPVQRGVVRVAEKIVFSPPPEARWRLTPSRMRTEHTTSL